MNLDRVTITGADDSVSIGRLHGLSKKFPFVEWGILYSKSQIGGNRFPSETWFNDLHALAGEIKLSLHLCGSVVRDLLVGINSMPLGLLPFLPKYQRIQLNFHAENAKCDPVYFYRALKDLRNEHQYIFQIDGSNGNEHMESVWAADVDAMLNCVPLFDISGGAGILPNQWPKPEYMANDTDHIYHGYAGGLGPENLEQQLPLIAEAAGNTRIWIDMETKVRSNNDRQFDLDKVAACLEICAPFVTQ